MSNKYFDMMMDGNEGTPQTIAGTSNEEGWPLVYDPSLARLSDYGKFNSYPNNYRYFDPFIDTISLNPVTVTAKRTLPSLHKASKKDLMNPHYGDSRQPYQKYEQRDAVKSSDYNLPPEVLQQRISNDVANARPDGISPSESMVSWIFPTMLSAGIGPALGPLSDAFYTTNAGQKVLPYATAAYKTLTNPWVDAGLSAYFGSQVPGNIQRGKYAEAALNSLPFVAPAYKTGKAIYEGGKTVANNVPRIINSIEAHPEWWARAAADVSTNPYGTYKAIKEGRYIHDFGSLRRNLKDARNAIMEGVRSTNNQYFDMTGVTVPELPINMKLGKKFFGLEGHSYDRLYEDINALLRQGDTNIVNRPSYFKKVGGHEQTHVAEDFLNDYYGIPSLGVYSNKTKYFIPNQDHPIANKYKNKFMNFLTNKHGKSPEETWANYMGSLANGDKFSTYANSNFGYERVLRPKTFINDYKDYLTGQQYMQTRPFTENTLQHIERTINNGNPLPELRKAQAQYFKPFEFAFPLGNTPAPNSFGGPLRTKGIGVKYW